ncbi:hypothetical protein SK128_026948, partial [Halocaridina rubra]
MDRSSEDKSTLHGMEYFVGKAREYYQGLPSSTRGYSGSALKDDGHAPPNPTPPATPTLPPAHAYHNPYKHPMTGAAPATSVHGLLPPSRPMTPVTPSHKPPDHTSAASPYSVASFLHPSGIKTPSVDHRYIAQLEQYPSRPAALAAVTATSTRPSDTLHGARALSQSSSHSYSSPHLGVSHDGRSLLPVHGAYASGAIEARPSQPHNSKQPLPNDIRIFPNPYGSQNSADSRMAHYDTRYYPKPETRPPDPLIADSRLDPRSDLRQEQWSLNRPLSKSAERLAPSVHVAEANVSVNGSKDALYLGKKSEEIPNVRYSQNSIIKKSEEPLQVNGSRDPLYPNGSYGAHSSESKRDSTSARAAAAVVVSHHKEDSALDLSVKTGRQTPDSTAPDLEKTHSNSPHGAVTIEKVSLKEIQRRTPSAVPTTSPHRTPSRVPSPIHATELMKNMPGISGTARGVSPSHSISQYGITGSPRPLQSPSPSTRPAHMLPPTKRSGDPTYFDHLSKYPRLSLTPPNKTNNKEPNIRYSGESVIERRPLYPDLREPGAEWRDRRDNYESRDPSLERREPRDLSSERREPIAEKVEASTNKKDFPVNVKQLTYDKRDIMVDPKYAYGRPSSGVAPTSDTYWLTHAEYLKHNSLQVERQKHVPGAKTVPTSVPTCLPQQNSRLPSAPPSSHTSFRYPPDARLSQTSYSQAGHPVPAAHPSRVNPAQSAPAKLHPPYGPSPSSKTNQVSTSQSSNYSQAQAPPGQIPSSSHCYHYPYPYNHSTAAPHYSQQQHRQQKSSSTHPSFSLPSSTVSPSMSSSSSSSSSSLPPPQLSSQQAAHAAYLHAQLRSEALHSSKRSNQLSPHPLGSPHVSVSPHPSASPSTAPSPHPSPSPHRKAASPHSTVSSHHSQQARIPPYSPHASQRPPSASASQHPSQGYPGSLPPSPYSSHQSLTVHTTPPSSRPSSATSQHSQQQRSPYSSLPSPSSLQHPPTHTSQPSQHYPASSQPHSSHPPQSHALPVPAQSRTSGHSQSHLSHPSLGQSHSSSVPSTRAHHSHIAAAYPGYPSQAHIYSQPQATWAQGYGGHVKAADSHYAQAHSSQSHSYPSQVYPPYSQSAVSSNSQAQLPHTHPRQSYPSQAHISHSSSAQTHPSATHPPQPPPVQAHVPQPHPSLAYPSKGHTALASPSQPHSSQPRPSYGPYAPQSLAGQARPSHPQSSLPPHPHPPPSEAHPRLPHPSQPYPQPYHSSQVHTPSQPHLPEVHSSPSQSSDLIAHASHPSQAHPSYHQPSQTHPPHSHTTQVHPSQRPSEVASQEPHQSQSHLPQQHASQSHPSHSHSTQPQQSHPSQSRSSQIHSTQPPSTQSNTPQAPSSQSQPIDAPLSHSQPSLAVETHSMPLEARSTDDKVKSQPPENSPPKDETPSVPSSKSEVSHSSQSQKSAHSFPPHPYPLPTHSSAPAHPSHTHIAQVHQSQTHPQHGYPPQPHFSHHSHPSHPSSQSGYSQTHTPLPHSPRGLPQNQTHTPQSHSPRGYSNQPHSPRSHPSQSHPHMYPSQDYSSQVRPSYDPLSQPYASQGHPPRTHHPPSHPQMRYQYPSVGHPYPPPSQSMQPTHQKTSSYVPQSPAPTSTPSQIPDASQAAHHLGYSHHGQHSYYPPPISHQNDRTDTMGGNSQYPYPYPAPHTAIRPDVAISGGPHHQSQQPVGTSSTSKQVQECDPSRIRTKGEQKAFDPRNNDSAKLSDYADRQPGHAANHNASKAVESRVIQELPKSIEVVPESSKTLVSDEEQKASMLDKEDGRSKAEQNIAVDKSMEPGKAALAEKLHKKLHHAESMENLITKKEQVPDCVVPKKEEDPVENEWCKGFDKLMDDLASNPESVTSRKSRSLGRRYLQKVQIQDAIDNDLIAPPIIDEEEEESEPEPPVKFRGKFKSIKDKRVERLILTYASHSDESAVEMIPDDDASDFEQELEREIRLKHKKRGHIKKVADTSSGSDAERKSNQRIGARGRNKENKPNNRQDSDYSYSSSSGSSSSSSTSSDDSDSEDSDSEVDRPRRGSNKKGGVDQRKKGKNWNSDSSDVDEEVIPKRRTRRGRKYSSDDESFKPSQRSKKRRKKVDSSDSDEIPLKTKSDSEEEEKFLTVKGKKTQVRKKLKKKQKESDEDSEEEKARKTRGMKKKLQDHKQKRRKTNVSSSSESEEDFDKRGKKKVDLRKKNNHKTKSGEDSSEDSDIPTKKKHISKSNVIVDSEESEQGSGKEQGSGNDTLKEKTGKDKEEIKKLDDIKKEEEETEKEHPEESEVQEEKIELGFNEADEIIKLKESDSVLKKLKKIRDEELGREDVQEMKVWLGEVNRDIKRQLGSLQDVTLRNYWRKPQFGAGDDFLQGWQTDVKKYKEVSARFPKKLCHAAKHQGTASTSKSSPRKMREQDGLKGSPKCAVSSPAKNTRSKSGIIKTSMAVAEDEKLKVAARPEISSVMQRFFDKVLGDGGCDSSKEESCRKFNLGPFQGFGAHRVPTGLTPTPSVAPSMLASDDSDLDSLASLRMDLPASDSVPVSRRSIANSLLKKIGRKYNDKKLNSLYLTKTRSILEVTNKPQLLPTPGLPTSEKDLEEMSPDQLKLSTFFRKETVNNYRGNFEAIMSKNGINEFTPILYQSRTRNKTKQIQDAATVKSVFGFDIPPHILKKKEVKQTKKVIKKSEKKDGSKKEESPSVPISRASTPAGSVLAGGEEDDDSELRSERSESVLGESSVSLVPKRVKRKFRKFRSGFDYIRKKKKVKADDEVTPSRKRLPVRKHVNWPEQSRDVASEVRSWVVNKGLGET